MLSEEEKAKIIEKVQFENEIKKTIDSEPKPKKFTWLNSKISLLLIGALISGILVPWFQYTQKSIEWKRQNRYDSISYRLDMMRDCVKEFVYLQAIRAEGFERVQPFVVKTTLDKNDYESFKSQFIELQNKPVAGRTRKRWKIVFKQVCSFQSRPGARARGSLENVKARKNNT